MTQFTGRQFAAMVLGTLSVTLILVGWELLARLRWINPFFISQPTAILAVLVAEARSGELFHNLFVTLREFCIGFGTSMIVGIALGILAGRHQALESVMDPFIWFLYSAPIIAFYPLFVIWFGLGSRMIAAITFLFSVTPIVVNTSSGVKGVSPALLNVAKSFGARQHDLLWKIIFPASVPMVVAGLRLGIGRALTGVIIAELFGGTAGLGFSIAYYGGLLRIANVWASLFVVVALALLCTQGLRALEARLDAWRTDPRL